MNLPVRLAGVPCLCVCAILLVTTAAHAATYTVGIGNGCTHSTIQSALDAAVANLPSTVYITRSATWSAQALTVAGSTNTGTLSIEGGYATCAQTTRDSTYTTISGVGASGPVFTINGVGSLTFRYLTIRDGVATRGGGIQVNGTGTVFLLDTTIQYNHADYGGGVYVDRGTYIVPLLSVGKNVLIANNIANFDGGGVYLNESTMTMFGSGSMLFGNSAVGQNNVGTGGGYGGGLMIRAGLQSAGATIGSAGVGTLGAIYGNSARFGGGVAITGAPPNTATVPMTAKFSLYTNLATLVAAIRANSASVQGGGIYIRSYENTNTGNVASSAQLWHAELTDNSAPDGAAVYLARHAKPSGSGMGARLEIDYGASPDHVCPSGDFCSKITGNGGLSAANPAPIISSDQGTVLIGGVPTGAPGNGVLVSGNAGAFVGGYDSCQFYMSNVQITGNASPWPIIGGACQTIEVSDTTIAGNGIDSANVIATDANLVLRRSIIWQPGKTTLGAGIGTRAISDIVTSESTSLNAANGLFITQADPWFIDPAHGDYGLQAASPAVDYALAIVGIDGKDRDAQGQPRNMELPIKANSPHPSGPRDIGALERQSLLPLVLDADFDFSDLRLWTWFAGEWDGTQNDAGGSASGSWKYSASGLTQSRVILGEQCIHLPGPGRYRISGSGKAGGNTMATRDYAILGWEFRRYGTASCNGGAPDTFGELTLGSGSSWGHPAQPAAIEVREQDWNTSSSITLRLIAEDGGVNSPRSISAWFDGITMDVESLADRIFANGFE